jgi:hypothetical protein
MSNKSRPPELRPRRRKRWYIYLSLGAAVVLAAAVGYYIGQQTEPAPTSGLPVKKPPKAGLPAPRTALPAKRKNMKGWITRTTTAPDQHRTSGRTEPVKTETATRLDAQKVAAEVLAALDDPNPRVRQAALERLESVDHPAVNPVLSKAINDTDEDVRDTAMDVISEIDSPNILDTLAEALTYGDADVRDRALDFLENISDLRTIDILIEKGLTNDNAEIEESALAILDGLTDQEFSSYQEARQWWDQNRETFQFDQ